LAFSFASTSLNAYPHIKNLYVSLNTTLPTSAAVERLFSLGGRVFSASSADAAVPKNGKMVESYMMNRMNSLN